MKISKVRICEAKFLVFYWKKKKSNGVMVKWKHYLFMIFSKRNESQQFLKENKIEKNGKNNNVKNDILDSCKDAKIIKVAQK